MRVGAPKNSARPRAMLQSPIKSVRHKNCSLSAESSDRYSRRAAAYCSASAYSTQRYYNAIYGIEIAEFIGPTLYFKKNFVRNNIVLFTHTCPFAPIYCSFAYRI